MIPELGQLMTPRAIQKAPYDEKAVKARVCRQFRKIRKMENNKSTRYSANFATKSHVL